MNGMLFNSDSQSKNRKYEQPSIANHGFHENLAIVRRLKFGHALRKTFFKRFWGGKLGFQWGTLCWKKPTPVRVKTSVSWSPCCCSQAKEYVPWVQRLQDRPPCKPQKSFYAGAIYFQCLHWPIYANNYLQFSPLGKKRGVVATYWSSPFPMCTSPILSLKLSKTFTIFVTKR